MKPVLGRVTVALAVLLVAAGCGRGVQREYTWTRQTPATGRRGPTTFVVRIAVDRGAQSIVWVEDVHDAEGDLGRQVKTWTDCTILDEQNWDCPPVFAPVEGEVVHISMRDGALRQRYWGEDRHFELHRRIGGFSF